LPKYCFFLDNNTTDTIITELRTPSLLTNYHSKITLDGNISFPLITTNTTTNKDNNTFTDEELSYIYMATVDIEKGDEAAVDISDNNPRNVDNSSINSLVNESWGPMTLVPAENNVFSSITSISDEVTNHYYQPPELQRPIARMSNKRQQQQSHNTTLSLSEEAHNKSNILVKNCFISYTKKGCREICEMICQNFDLHRQKRSPIFVPGNINLCFFESVIASLCALQYFRVFFNTLKMNPIFISSNISVITPELLCNMVIKHALECVSKYDKTLKVSRLETFRFNESDRGNNFFGLRFPESIDLPMHFEIKFSEILLSFPNVSDNVSLKSIVSFYTEFKHESQNENDEKELPIYEKECNLRALFDSLIGGYKVEKITEELKTFVSLYESTFTPRQLKKLSVAYLGFNGYKDQLREQYIEQFSNIMNSDIPTFNNELCILYTAQILGVRIHTHKYVPDNNNVSINYVFNEINNKQSADMHSIHLYLVENHWGTDVSEMDLEETNSFERFGRTSQYTQALTTAQSVLFGPDCAAHDFSSIRTQHDVVLEDYYHRSSTVESPNQPTKRSRKPPPQL
jgi:hypothetical protein